MSSNTYGAVFLSGRLLPHLLRMAGAAYTALFVVQIADLLALLYVYHTGRQVDIAGLGVAMTVFFIAFVANIGSSAAVSACLAKSAVRDSDIQLRQVATSTIILSTAAGLVSSLLLLALMNPAFDLLGLQGEARDVATRYLVILAPVNAVQAFAMASAAAMRGLGRARSGMLITLFGATANLIVDPIFILVLHLGVDGAALGVWVGRLVQLAVAVVLLSRAGLLVRPRWAELRHNAGPFLGIAMPAAVAAVATPLASAFLMYIVAPFGDAARSALFTVDKIAAFAFGFPLTVAQAIGPIVAQNYAAGDLGRALRTLRLFCLVSFSYMLLVGTGVVLARRPLIGLFAMSDGEAISLTMFYLSIVGLALFGTSVINASNAVFQNTGRPALSMYMNWFRAGLIAVPSWMAVSVYGTAASALSGYVAGVLICAAIALPIAVLALRPRERGVLAQQLP